ncbi:MAG: hypothetical protein DCC55_15850 [Chloroflexi bacterium]|nr:MAG: hypothetical protein DCC55_15850 [Chloroflexota bacterium]
MQLDRSSWLVYLAVLAAGIGIGWLTGLAASPVVATLLSAVTGAVVAVVAALGGIERTGGVAQETEGRHMHSWRVNPLPLAALMVGVVGGTMLGMLARNYHWFGSDVSSEVAKWAQLGVAPADVVDRLFEAQYPHLALTTTYTPTFYNEVNHWETLGLARADVVQRLFEKRHPADGLAPVPASPSESQAFAGSVLFSSGAAECESLLAAAAVAEVTQDGQVLVNALLSSTDAALRRLPSIVEDPEILRELVEEILCADGSSS